MFLPPIVRHVHLPGVTPFKYAQSLQQALVSKLLAHKALVSSHSASPAEVRPPVPPPPTPTILTFSPTPVYTLGRREYGSLSDAQEALLRAPLTPQHVTHANPYRQPEVASVEQTLRGGQTTFHGPGQLVVYPIMDLKPAIPYVLHGKGLSVRQYVDFLEEITISSLAEWGITGIRTENPGVWESRGQRKIAALGVHLRRNITSYGIGLNVETDLHWFDRIVACGLEGKGATSLLRVATESEVCARKPVQDHQQSESCLEEAEHGMTEETCDGNSELFSNSETKTERKLPNDWTSQIALTWVRLFGRELHGPCSTVTVTPGEIAAELGFEKVMEAIAPTI